MTASVDLRHLRYFVAVAEELSFTVAAKRLGMAQPPLSQQIRQLEEVVGSPLFERIPRVKLTEAGVVFLEVARRTLSQLALGVDLAGRVGRGAAGKLTVGFASSVVFTGLPNAFSAFASRCPDVAFQLREMHSGAQLEALRAGTIDIGFSRESSTDPDLEVETIFRESFIAVLPERHPLAKLSSVAPRQLAREEFVLFPREIAPMLYDQIAAVCRAGDFSPQVKHQALEWHTVSGLVGAGLGVSIAPAGLSQLRWPGACYRPLKPLSVRTAIVMCRRRELNRGVIDSFVEVLRESL
jgi:DNA-binding transcriptional LysR family regulator